MFSIYFGQKLLNSLKRIFLFICSPLDFNMMVMSKLGRLLFLDSIKKNCPCCMHKINFRWAWKGGIWHVFLEPCNLKFMKKITCILTLDRYLFCSHLFPVVIGQFLVHINFIPSDVKQTENKNQITVQLYFYLLLCHKQIDDKTTITSSP